MAKAAAGSKALSLGQSLAPQMTTRVCSAVSTRHSLICEEVGHKFLGPRADLTIDGQLANLPIGRHLPQPKPSILPPRKPSRHTPRQCGDSRAAQHDRERRAKILRERVLTTASCDRSRCFVREKVRLVARELVRLRYSPDVRSRADARDLTSQDSAVGLISAKALTELMPVGQSAIHSLGRPVREGWPSANSW